MSFYSRVRSRAVFLGAKLRTSAQRLPGAPLRGVLARLPHSKYSSLEPFTSNSESQFDTEARSMQYIPQTELHPNQLSFSSQKGPSPQLLSIFATASL
ncbi:MAG: hypothetical protein ACBR12_13625 [Microcoleus sp.]|uniref:hypothetical protein n=1 Tax=Microcoleus sp. TaxID=44472 RepID=UPI003524A8D0